MENERNPRVKLWVNVICVVGKGFDQVKMDATARTLLTQHPLFPPLYRYETVWAAHYYFFASLSDILRSCLYKEKGTARKLVREKFDLIREMWSIKVVIGTREKNKIENQLATGAGGIHTAEQRTTFEQNSLACLNIAILPQP